MVEGTVIKFMTLHLKNLSFIIMTTAKTNILNENKQNVYFTNEKLNIPNS